MALRARLLLLIGVPLAVHGGEFSRSADLYTEPGDEDTLIARIAAALPSSYRPWRGTPVAANAAPLLATVGAVELSVGQLGAGWVTAKARTGCTTGRPPADTVVDGADGCYLTMYAIKRPAVCCFRSPATHTVPAAVVWRGQPAQQNSSYRQRCRRPTVALARRCCFCVKPLQDPFDA